MKIKINVYLFVLLLYACAGSCFAASITMMRVFKEHKVSLVTTENFDSLEKYWLDWNIHFDKIINISELIYSKDSFPAEGDTVFVIDRSKLKNLSPEISNLLFVKSSAIGDNELITAISKSAKKLNPKYDNGWQMIISAPNQKWLNFEMQRIAPKKSMILYQSLSEAGINILDKYSVKHINVITTESPLSLEKWFNKQFDYKNEAIDPDYFDIQNTDKQPDPNSDSLYFLDRTKITKISDLIKEIMPDNIIEWSSNPLRKFQYITGIESNNLNNSYILCYPVNRLLNNSLTRFESLKSISSSIKTSEFNDLAKYSQVTIISNASSSNADTQQVWESDIASRLASEITSKIGLKCANRQDLKQSMYEAIQNRQSSAVVKSDSKTKQVSLLAVIDINPTAVTTYYSPAPKCITEKYPAFSEVEPVRPESPNPERVDLFSGHHYKIVDGSRKNDPKYIKDCDVYLHEKKVYPEKHSRWESKRRDYEDSRDYHQMQWVRTINEVQKVKVSGNIKFYELSSVDSPTQAVLILNQPISAQVSVDNEFKNDTIILRGESFAPAAIRIPDNRDGIYDSSLYTSTFTAAIKKGVNLIISGSVTPLDLRFN